VLHNQPSPAADHAAAAPQQLPPLPLRGLPLPLPSTPRLPAPSPGARGSEAMALPEGVAAGSVVDAAAVAHNVASGGVADRGATAGGGAYGEGAGGGAAGSEVALTEDTDSEDAGVMGKGITGTVPPAPRGSACCAECTKRRRRAQRRSKHLQGVPLMCPECWSAAAEAAAAHAARATTAERALALMQGLGAAHDANALLRQKVEEAAAARDGLLAEVDALRRQLRATQRLRGGCSGGGCSVFGCSGSGCTPGSGCGVRWPAELPMVGAAHALPQHDAMAEAGDEEPSAAEIMNAWNSAGAAAAAAVADEYPSAADIQDAWELGGAAAAVVAATSGGGSGGWVPTGQQAQVRLNWEAA
jgi:hypothetical protein